MRTPIISMDLGKDMGYQTEAGEDIVVKVPRSVTEGFTYELGLLGTDVDKADAKAIANNTRDTQIKVLELVQGWNVDDAKGQPVPLVKDIVHKDPDKQRELRVAAIQTIPIEITKAIVERVTSSTRVNPRVEGF